jgi:hypothetical protein
MRIQLSPTVAKRILLCVLAAFAVAGLLTVPSLLAPSTFLALAGLMVAFTWVLMTTVVNAQPASSLAQSLHDIDSAASADRRTKR